MRVGRFLKYALACFLLFLGYAAFEENTAARASAEFCAAIAVGMPIEALQRRLAADTAHDHAVDFPDGILIIFTGVPPFSRHICRVEMAAAHVTAKHLEYLD